MSNQNNISIENAHIFYKNFRGAAGQFNAEGDRNFCVELTDPVLVEQLKADGWNVRFLRPLDEHDEPKPYVQVKVSYKVRAPKVVLITSRGMTNLDEDTVDLLDSAEIEKVDLLISGHPWNMNGRHGIKGYLKAIYVTIVEDEFEKKYAAQETSALNSLPF